MIDPCGPVAWGAAIGRYRHMPARGRPTARLPFIAIAVVFLVGRGDTALPDSLPSVPSGARPGPDVLYAAPADAPQLENRDPRFRAAPLLVSGAEAYVAGEYLYQDYLYDDYGSDTNGAGATPLSPNTGDITYPTDRARYGGNAADLVEFRISVAPDSVAYRITLNTLLAPDSTIVVIAFDTDHDALTGVATLPRDPGAPFPGTDEAITIWGSGAEHTRFSFPLPVTTPLAVSTDLDANQMTVVVPRTVSDPSTVWRTTVAVGLYDPATGGWLRPQSSATATTPGGAGPLDPLPSGIFNLAFRFDEPFVASDTPPDTKQAAAIRNHTPTAYAHDIDFGALSAGVNSSTVPASGMQIRMFASHLALGEGRDFTKFPAYLGSLQPYSLYVPTTYSPTTPAGLTLNLHSLAEHYWQYNGKIVNQQIGEQRGNLVATSLSRGPDGWYEHEGEYDTFEMWSDVAAHFNLDPDRTAISGYSMGGYATYRLGTLYPDLFGKAFSQVGPPAEGIWLPPAPPTGGYRGTPPGPAPVSPAPATLTNLWLENARNVPYLNLAGSSDQLVPLAGPRAQNLGAPELGIRGFDQLGYRFRFLIFTPADHFALAINNYDFPMAPAFLGDAHVDRNPPHVTFAYVPDADDPGLGLVHDHAYWLSALELANLTPGASTPSKGVVDAFSHGFGVGDPASTAGTAQGTLGPFTYQEFNRSWATPPAIPVANVLDLTLRNIASVRIDLARANLDSQQDLTVPVDADSSGTLELDGTFPGGRSVLRDGAILPGGSAGPAGATIPVSPGSHVYQITALGPFELRRVRLSIVGGGLDRLALRGRIHALLAQLGLPGASLTVTLANAGGDFFSATVPAASLVPNRHGTRSRFRDPSATVAGGITSLTIGGRRRTDLRMRARNLNLAGAAPGPFTTRITIGSRILLASGSLRSIAHGTRLSFP